jgi:hypothetical protein
MFHAIWLIKKRLFGPGGVANPCDSTRYRCGLRLARTKNSSFFMGASKRKTSTLHWNRQLTALHPLPGLMQSSVDGPEWDSPHG